jgi:hypothetical protein
MRKILALGGAIVGLTGIFAATAAQGAFTITTKKCGEGIPTACIESEGKLFEAQGEETYTGKLQAKAEALMETKLGKSTILITCKTDKSEGVARQPEPSVKAVTGEGKLVFGGCTVSPKNCKVSETLTTNMLTGTVADEMPIKSGTVKAASGSTIITIMFKGEECLLKGAQAISGEDLCISMDAETDLSVHTGECLAEGSKLTFGSEATPVVFEAKVEGEFSGPNKEKKSDVSLG